MAEKEVKLMKGNEVIAHAGFATVATDISGTRSLPSRK